MVKPHNPLQPVQVVRGRGSASRMAHRYATESHVPFDDGWPGVPEPGDVGGNVVLRQRFTHKESISGVKKALMK